LFGMPDDWANVALDAVGLLGNGPTDNFARFNIRQQQREALLIEQQKLMYEKLEAERKWKHQEDQRAAIRQAMYIPGETVQSAYPLGADEYMDDQDLLNLYGVQPGDTEVGMPFANQTQQQGRYASTPEEVRAAMPRIMATGEIDMGELNPLLGHYVNMAEGKVMSPGSTLYDDYSGEARYTAPAAVAQPEIIKGADGYNYWSDTGQRVLPGVELPAGGWKDPAERHKAERELSKDFAKITAGFETVRKFGSVIEGALDDGANDNAMVIAINKMLEPDSVVRESESRAAADVAGQLATFKNLYASFSEGDKLPPEARRDIKALAKRLLTIWQTDYKRKYKEYGRVATEGGLKPENIYMGAYDPFGADAARRRNVSPHLQSQLDHIQRIIDRREAR
jgi:hypothetical protein